MSVGNALLEALATVGNIVDTPRAMAWELARGNNPFDVANPFDDEAVSKRATGWDLLDALGIKGQEGFDWTDPLAVGAEMIFDPINAAMLAKGAVSALRANRTIKAVDEANAVGRATVAEKLAKSNAWNEGRAAEIQKRWMPAEIADETLVRQGDMPPQEWLRQFYETRGESLPDAHALERQVGAAMSMDPSGRSGRGFYGELANALESAPKVRGDLVPVYHGTADVYDIPSEVATQANSYSRSGEYSRHPPVHFTTPDESLAEYYATEAAKEKIANSPEAQRVLRGMSERLGSLDDESRRLAQWSRDPAMGVSGELIEQTRQARNQLQDAIRAIQGGEMEAIPGQVIERQPWLATEPWVPQKNIRAYFADVRNPISESGWEGLAAKHGWADMQELRGPGAAMRALEEAKGLGYDAIASDVTGGWKNIPGLPLPEEIAPFSYDQLYAPHIARRLAPIPKPYMDLPSPPAYSMNKLLSALGLYNAERGMRGVPTMAM